MRIAPLTLFCLLVACLFSVPIQAADGVFEAGKYDLVLNIQGKEQQKNAAQVSKVGESQLIVDTVDGLGEPLQLKGVADQGVVKFGVTQAERKSLVTIHFISTSTKARSAEGRMVIFADGKKVAEGTWQLAPHAAKGSGGD